MGDDYIYKLEPKKVAIIMATYNGENYIEAQLKSIKAQSYTNYCCFIHDDNSNDRTKEILQKFCCQNKEHFVIIDSPPRGGAKENFMYLLKSISADYIMFCDQDDIWFPNKIERTLNEMKKIENGENYVCVHSDLKVVNSELDILNSSYYNYTGKNPNRNRLNHLLIENVVVGCTMMINSNLRTQALKVENENNIFMHDWWIALIAATEGELVFIEEPLMLYRQHEGNSVGAFTSKSFLDKLIQYIYLKKTIDKKFFKINRARKFAKELSNIIDNRNAYYKFIKEYSVIKRESKIKRIKFYYKNKLFNDNKSIFWQLLWV
ncbi:glycosyltransferase family 2 protein [Clostridium saudiense]|uniref:glycosyltransferase family 2 protein n=1 Tax=Clostridium saudiense TaxID=1414720 RepID=UPI002670B597|nr:glycosyltransferase family 2 protein [Clostridium saudiense]